MSTPITPAVNIPPATYPIPAAGDGVNSSNTAQYVQPIADAIAWLRSRLPGANPPGSLIRLPAINLVAGPDASWLRLAASNAWLNQGHSNGDIVVMPFQLVPGTVIRAFSCYLTGASGHGSYPGAMTVPSLALSRRQLSSGTTTAIDSQVDVSANVASYEAYHSVSKTLASPYTVVAGELILLTFSNEYGSGSLANTSFSGGALDVSSL